MTLLHVAFGFHDKPVDVEELRKVFDGAPSWARYAPNCWIIQSSEVPQVWAERFRQVCSKHDSIFIVEIDPDNHGGYLEKEIWDWFKRAR